jgi:hypothetical protein
MLDTDADIKNAIQQFALGLAATYCPKRKKASVRKGICKQPR